MKLPRLIACVSTVILLAGCTANLSAQHVYPTTRAAEALKGFSVPGVTIHVEQRKDPNMSVYVAKIDLAKQNIIVSMAGEDPDGPTSADGTTGTWHTTLMRTRDIAEREKLDFAVNADFFVTDTTTDAEGKKVPNYTVGNEGKVTGVTIANTADPARGVVINPETNTGKPHAAVVVNADGSITIRDVKSVEQIKGARAVASGRDILVKEGKALFDQPPKDGWGSFRGKNPRTVAGISKDGKTFILMVVDGRSERSVGMTFGELANEMVKQGAWTAVNLDGGGSSTFVVHTGNEWKVVNGSGVQRPIANIIGSRKK